MTDEEKIVVQEKKECHCECGKILTKFLLNTTSIFLGALLAILVASALLRPQTPPCPCKMGHHPGFERQMPPMGMHWQKYGMKKFHGNKDFKKFEKGQRPDFNKFQKDDERN